VARLNRVTPERIRLVLLILLLILAVSPAFADTLARVVSVHDGDTLTVLIDHRQVRVRLTEIDAPELRQPFGTRSRQSLSELCFGKTATLDVRGHDRYRRTLAQVTCSGTDANAEQVRRGLAWTYARYAKADSPLFAIQRTARTEHRGLWSDPEPMAPWDWRRGDRSRSQGGS
jgi:endonuclease YncB( thermonuclease family)